jgi:hypothetical protein
MILGQHGGCTCLDLLAVVTGEAEFNRTEFFGKLISIVQMVPPREWLQIYLGPRPGYEQSKFMSGIDTSASAEDRPRQPFSGPSEQAEMLHPGAHFRENII